MMLKLFVLCAFVSGYAAEELSHVNSDTSAWTSPGAEVAGFSILDIREIEVLDEESSVSLNSLVAQPDMTKAVLQVIDTLPSGGVCMGCVRSGRDIYRSIQSSPGLSSDTTYIMIISADSTPSINAVNQARRGLDPNVKIVRDIDGAFQRAFRTSNFPVTLVLESKYRGKVLNMHGQQPATVIRTLTSLPAN